MSTGLKVMALMRLVPPNKFIILGHLVKKYNYYKEIWPCSPTFDTAAKLISTVIQKSPVYLNLNKCQHRKNQPSTSNHLHDQHALDADIIHKQNILYQINKHIIKVQQVLQEQREQNFFSTRKTHIRITLNRFCCWNNNKYYIS
eukprot:TRINITY_DN2142_c0_g1_i1.p10 TRINITY_DN2142_c0_g1~~TRINITY_DN2142_c0_g1_i1.p10  ORF type:complete len:144 (+),score=2.33 TRINITY_DN2142_c0_g1_i1:947-1378(+)